jgi:hypothetical protein
LVHRLLLGTLPFEPADQGGGGLSVRPSSIEVMRMVAASALSTAENLPRHSPCWEQMPAEARGLVSGLLRLEPAARLGMGDARFRWHLLEPLREHPFLRQLDMAALLSKSLDPPPPPPPPAPAVVLPIHHTAPCKTTAAAQVARARTDPEE